MLASGFPGAMSSVGSNSDKNCSHWALRIIRSDKDIVPRVGSCQNLDTSWRKWPDLLKPTHQGSFLTTTTLLLLLQISLRPGSDCTCVCFSVCTWACVCMQTGCVTQGPLAPDFKGLVKSSKTLDVGFGWRRCGEARDWNRKRERECERELGLHKLWPPVMRENINQ